MNRAIVTKGVAFDRVTAQSANHKQCRLDSRHPAPCLHANEMNGISQQVFSNSCLYQLHTHDARLLGAYWASYTFLLNAFYLTVRHIITRPRGEILSSCCVADGLVASVGNGWTGTCSLRNISALHWIELHKEMFCCCQLSHQAIVCNMNERARHEDSTSIDTYPLPH